MNVTGRESYVSYLSSVTLCHISKPRSNGRIDGVKEGCTFEVFMFYTYDNRNLYGTLKVETEEVYGGEREKR